MKKTVLKPLVFIMTMVFGFTMLIDLISITANADDETNNITAPRYTADNPLIVVSMGDSYSAGEGIEPFYGQKVDDNDENSKEKTREEKVKSGDWIAHRSTKSWPSLLEVPNGEDNYIKLRDYKCNDVEKVPDDQICQWYFVAASGAETKHFYQDFDKGVATYVDGVSVIEQGKVLKPQLDVFKNLSGKVDYVTMSIGGNDMGFVDIVITAATPKIFNPTKIENLLNDTRKNWENQIRKKVRKTYESVFEAAGHQVDIIVTGYPELYYRDVDNWQASKEEREMIDDFAKEFCNAKDGEIVQIVKALNDEVKDKGWSGGIHYISVIDEFQGKGAGASNEWINRIKISGNEVSKDIPINLDDIDSVKKYIFQFTYSSMHPNADGANAYAKLVNEKIKEIENKKQKNKKTLKLENHYTWAVEPTIEAEDIIVFDERIANDAVSLSGITKDVDLGHLVGHQRKHSEFAIIKNNNNYGFIDYNGNILLEPIYPYVKYCECGEVAVTNGVLSIDDEPKCMHISDDNSIINGQNAHGVYPDTNVEIKEKTFDKVYSDTYGESNIAACQKNGKWGYYSFSGEEILPFEFDNIDLIIPSNYNQNEIIEVFLPTDGYIAVCKDGGWGYYDTDGNAVIPCGEFEQARPVYDGHAWVKKDGKWGIISLGYSSVSGTPQDQTDNVYTASWQQAYADFLRSNVFNTQIDPDSEWNSYYDKFSLCYVDDDDIPELLLVDAIADRQAQMGVANASPLLYSYANGKISYIGAQVGNQTFSYLEHQGKIVANSHTGNAGGYTLLELQNGNLSELHHWSYNLNMYNIDGKEFEGTFDEFVSYLKENVIDESALTIDEGQYDLTEENINTVLTSESGSNIQTDIIEGKTYHGNAVFANRMKGDEYTLDYSDNSFILTDITKYGHTDTFSVMSHENNVYRVNDGVIMVYPDGTIQVSVNGVPGLIMT